MIRFILMDIEGTTTSISFVHEVLFPYASKHMEAFVRDHAADANVQKELQSVKQTVLEEDQKQLTDRAAIEQLLDWIKADRKHTALKNLQGYLWKEGYETGQYKGHIYDDVVPVLKKWKSDGIQLGIYSSGSVEAQKLLFGYSEKGDLRPYLTAYFDTHIGHKKERSSYRKIQQSLNWPAESILFLSDVEAELDAAQSAGLETMQLVRPGTKPSDRHTIVHSFDEIDLNIKQ